MEHEYLRKPLDLGGCCDHRENPRFPCGRGSHGQHRARDVRCRSRVRLVRRVTSCAKKCRGVGQSSEGVARVGGQYHSPEGLAAAIGQRLGPSRASRTFSRREIAARNALSGRCSKATNHPPGARTIT